MGKQDILVYLTVASDGSEETDYVVYDSSAHATTLGISDPLTCTLREVYFSSNSAAGVLHLEWDATTDVLAIPLTNQAKHLCFDKIGGLKNQGGTGRTGDITLTTTGLAAGDSIMIVLKVRMD